MAAKATIVYGRTEMSWEHLSAVLSIFASKPHVRPRYTQSYKNALHLLEFSKRFGPEGSMSMLDAMRCSGHALATDPRDKIYALLGLCRDGATFVPLPNYKQSLETVITDIGRLMMTMNRSLDLMCLKGTNHSQSPQALDLPSWAPDLTSLWSRPLTIQESTFDSWSKTGASNPILEGSSRRILKVRAKHLAIIRRLSSGIKSDGTFDRPETTQIPWISSVSKLKQIKPRIFDAREDDIHHGICIWHTLTMGLLQGKLTPDKLRSCVSTLWRPRGRGAIQSLALIAWIDRNAWFKVDQFTLREWSQLVAGDRQSRTTSLESRRKSTTEDFELFVKTLERVIESGMKLAVSRSGLFQAMVHPDAAEGDRVVSIEGCSIPVVLRPVEGHQEMLFQVVGGAYVCAVDGFAQLDMAVELTNLE